MLPSSSSSSAAWKYKENEVGVWRRRERESEWADAGCQLCLETDGQSRNINRSRLFLYIQLSWQSWCIRVRARALCVASICFCFVCLRRKRGSRYTLGWISSVGNHALIHPFRPVILGPLPISDGLFSSRGRDCCFNPIPTRENWNKNTDNGDGVSPIDESVFYTMKNWYISSRVYRHDFAQQFYERSISLSPNKRR